MLFLFLYLLTGAAGPSESAVSLYVQSMEERGTAPLEHLFEIFKTRDLILFDDAMHHAQDPWDFYAEMVADDRFQQQVGTIFLEVISISKQPHVDAYLASPNGDEALLYPVFQNDFSGYGFAYANVFTFLRAVWQANRHLTGPKKLRVFGVANPTYWSEIRNAGDHRAFQRSLASYDSHMYRVILQEMGQFKNGRKGVFLTNTRHSYKAIRNGKGDLYWNTGTYFHQHHPGKTWSIRIHGPALWINRIKAEVETERTQAGMERLDYRWVRMERGLWDAAFEKRNYKPVVVPTADTPFGKAAYVGNHMADAAPNQTMADAYDAILFWRSIDQWRQTAVKGDLYTPAFKRELARRMQFLLSEAQRQERINQSGAANLAGYIDQGFVSRPEQPLPQLKALPPIEAE